MVQNALKWIAVSIMSKNRWSKRSPIRVSVFYVVQTVVEFDRLFFYVVQTVVEFDRLFFYVVQTVVQTWSNSATMAVETDSVFLKFRSRINFHSNILLFGVVVCL